MTLLDRFGREIKKGRPITEELAVGTVRDRYSTYPSKGLTPERLANIFREADQGSVQRQAELFEEMEEKDTHLHGILGTRKLAVTGLPWEIQPATDSAEDKKIAEAAREAFDYIEDLDSDLMDILDATGKGFSVCELIWEASEKQAWINEIKWRHQKLFTFYDRESILERPRLLTEAEPFYGEDLVPNKFVYYRSRARSGIAPRGGLLRPCAWMYLFKNYTLKDWIVFAERYAMPLRMGKYQPGATDAEKEVLKQAVFNLGSDAAAVISDSTIIEILESQGKSSSADTYEKLANFCEKSMTKAVLGHEGSASSTPGKLGNDEQAGDVRQDILEADAKALERVVKFQVLAPYVAFNFGPDKGVPKFKVMYEPDEDLEQTSTVYSTLSGMGLRIPEKHVRERFGIPEPEGDEPVIEPRAPIAPAFGAPPQGEEPKPQANKACPHCGVTHMSMKSGGDKDIADSIVERLLVEAPAEGMVGKVAELVNRAGSLEELRDGLLDIYKDMDVTELGSVIQRALVVAEMSGRYHASRA